MPGKNKPKYARGGGKMGMKSSKGKKRGDASKRKMTRKRRK